MNSKTIMEVYFDTKPGTFRTPLDCLNARGIFSGLKLFGRYDGDNYDTMWPIKMTDILFWRRFRLTNILFIHWKGKIMISNDKIISINIWLIRFA